LRDRWGHLRRNSPAGLTRGREAGYFKRAAGASTFSYVQDRAVHATRPNYAMRLAMGTHVRRPAKATRKRYARDERTCATGAARERDPDGTAVVPVLDAN